MKRYAAFMFVPTVLVSVANTELTSIAQFPSDHAAVVAAGDDRLGVEFTAPILEPTTLTKGGREFETYSIPGEGILVEYGKPVLPAVSRFIVVPPDAGLELVVTGVETPRALRSIRPPAVCDMEWAKAERSPFEGGGGSIYPPVVATLGEPFIIRGVRLVKLTVYPVQYDSESRSFIHHPNLHAEIRFTDADPVNPVHQPIRRRRSRDFLKFMRALALNGDVVGRDDPDRDRDPEYLGHYLIVSHESCLQYAAPFIEFRRKSGYKVDILRIASGMASGNPDGVKNLIQNKYNEYVEEGVDPFDYILLIGDRRVHNYGGQPGANWVLESFAGEMTWGTNNHADYLFACLEGNDRNPDVGIARWHHGSQALMGLTVGRTLAYAAEPYMEDTDWFTRGGNYSQHWGNGEFSAWHISIQSNARWGEEVLQQLGFDEVHFYEYIPHDRQGQRIGPVLQEWLDEGLNVMVGRAENYYWGGAGNGGGNFANVRDNVVFPINICHSGHGEWTAEIMTRIGSGDHLKGPVAMTYGWGNPQYTAPITAIWLEMVRGVLLVDMPWGWSRSYAINAIELYFEGNQQNLLTSKTEFDCMGDPGLQPWIGVPRIVELTIPEQMSPETRIVAALVTDPEDDSPVEGAQVTAYAPGNMPAFNNANYATYNGMFMVTRKSDAQGRVSFVFDEDVDFDSGDMFLTVTGRDIRPVFGETDIAARRAAAEIDDYALTETEGNEDGEVNPGETFALAVDAVNLSNETDLEGVTAVVISGSPWVEVAEGEIEFGDIGAGETVEGQSEAVLHISPACPDAASRPVTKPQIYVDFRSGESTWRSAIELQPSAPHFKVNRIIGGDVIDVGANDIDIELTNIGSRNAAASTVTISSLGLGVSVVRETAEYPAIAAGRNARIAGDDLVVAGNQLAVPGSRHSMMMVVTGEDEFVDTVFFDLQVGEPAAGAPQGPDGYGYICFDDTDDDWDIAPDYEWVEISRRENDREHDGTACDFNGRSEFDIGEAQVVDLGFTTQFYGYEYDQITIALNGFISPGEQPRIVNFQNWPLDRGIGGGAGMIAPFWDDLRLRDDSGVYYFYDEDNHRFIVEWYKMGHASGGNADLTFQVIILDKDIWITETGDPNIIFQYKSISDAQNIRQGDNAWVNNTPFASVGISSPDGSTGLSYSYNNRRPVTSAPLQARRALLFGTSPRYRSGFLWGHVTDAETGEPVEGATVYTQHGFTATTDEEGYWRILDALAEVPFDITASKLGYNDSTFVDTLLAEDDSLEIDFALLHPEFTPSVQGLSAELEEGESVERPFEVFNGGNGVLTWRAELQLRGDANADPWELRRNYNVGAATRDNRLEGVAFIDDLFYVSGHSGEPTIYILNREGELVGSFPQPGADEGYMRDLTWDGELLWGAASRQIIGFTLDGEIVHSFEGQYNPSTCITWDPVLELLWVGSTTSDPIGYDVEGNRVRSLGRRGLRLYGLSYWPQDPDGFPLYIYNSPTGGAQVVTKMNPETGDTMAVRFIETAGRPGGAFITNQFDVYSWVFMALVNDGGDDRIDIWQLDARRDWMAVDLHEGVLDPEAAQGFTLTLDATGLPPVLFEADIVYYHNAEGGQTLIPISLDVIPGVGDPDVRALDLHQGWNMISLNVEPTDPNLPALLEPLVEAGRLFIIKDGRGRFYWPEQDFNNIPGWAVTDGYQVFLNEPSQFEAEGLVVAGDQPIPLEEGWNLKAYFPRQPVDAVAALSSIREQLVIAKDGYGRFYMPGFGFSNMGALRPGQGYQFKVSAAVDLSYREAPEGGFVRSESPRLRHFAPVAPTGSNLSVLLLARGFDAAESGYEIGVYNRGSALCGSGGFDAAGRCGLAVWGDDALTESVDGMVEGETLTFTLWNGEREIPVLPESVHGEPIWTADGIFVGRILDLELAPAAFGLSGAYPNPFNSIVRLRYGLGESGAARLSVYDLAGRRIAELVNAAESAGNHEAVWDAGAMPSGIFIARLEQGGRHATLKVTLVK